MEIRDNSDDDLPLNEALTLYGIVKLLDQFSKEDTKYYSQLFSISYTCWRMMELMSQKV